MSKCIVRNVTEHRAKAGVVTLHARGWLPVTCRSSMKHFSLWIRTVKAACPHLSWFAV